MKLFDQKCFNHMQREAAARCPQCGRFFCRECVTDHEGRLVCAACLKKMAAAAAPARPRLAGMSLFLQSAFAFFLLWLTVYYLGQALLRLPDSFHEGTLWNSGQETTDR
ncbi:MAG: rhomboid family protein [Verrucomicrobia bacterium]|nr:rhomboid family protein [Verrucomicrobiota bacterium]